MSGRYVRLGPGRYTLDVSGGEGPAGVHRDDGRTVRVDVDGGRVDFQVARDEEVYYWWRGPRERPGVRLLGVIPTARRSTRKAGEAGTWPTASAG